MVRKCSRIHIHTLMVRKFIGSIRLAYSVDLSAPPKENYVTEICQWNKMILSRSNILIKTIDYVPVLYQRTKKVV